MTKMIVVRDELRKNFLVIIGGDTFIRLEKRKIKLKKRYSIEKEYEMPLSLQSTATVGKESIVRVRLDILAEETGRYPIDVKTWRIMRRLFRSGADIIASYIERVTTSVKARIAAEAGPLDMISSVSFSLQRIQEQIDKALRIIEGQVGFLDLALILSPNLNEPLDVAVFKRHEMTVDIISKAILDSGQSPYGADEEIQSKLTYVRKYLPKMAQIPAHKQQEVLEPLLLLLPPMINKSNDLSKV